MYTIEKRKQPTSLGNLSAAFRLSNEFLRDLEFVDVALKRSGLGRFKARLDQR